MPFPSIMLAALVLGAGVSALLAQDPPPIISPSARFHPEVASRGIVASRERLASEAGLAMLRRGGNAVDAAVATGFVLAVTTPQAGNLGGGGFMLVHLAATGETVAIDFREKAPAAATRDMFLDASGEPDPELSRYSHLAVGVPGSVAGLELALTRYGTLSLAEVMAPAIALAEDGFPVSRDLAYALYQARTRLLRRGAAGEAFFREDGFPVAAGETLRLPELARVLRDIAAEGSRVFYEGWIADRLVEDMAANGGLLTASDLARYEAVVRPTTRGHYRGFEVHSMPPPSSGGVHIVQMLNILEGFDLRRQGHNSAAGLHLLAETMKRAYADRSQHLGDSDFHPVPVDWLTAPTYAASLRAGIDPARAKPSVEIAPGTPPREGDQTTHFSVLDAAGNAVACTTTVNFSFGNAYVVPGLGFFLNNEMDDFSAKPGVPNAYGLIGGEANAVEAEKRMLSSMSPTIVMREGRPWLVVGSPGGSRIINATLQVILNVIDHEMNLAEAVAAPRVHHQWLPDVLYFEKGVSIDTLELLRGRGFTVEQRGRIGNVNAVMAEEGALAGVADPRGLSGWVAGW
jgi:gamma-glutamyltranspeptidase / glutathione hydrolase